MNSVTQAITALNAAITALQTRLGSGILVQQADLDAAAASINAAATTIGTIAS